MRQEDVFSVLKAVLGEVVPEVDVDAVTPEDSMRELGANSIDRAEVITLTLERLGISRPLVRFADAGDLADIVEIMCAGEVPS